VASADVMSQAAARSGDLSEAAYAGTYRWHVVLTEPGAAPWTRPCAAKLHDRALRDDPSRGEGPVCSANPVVSERILAGRQTGHILAF
jgi:hypothetical protein